MSVHFEIFLYLEIEPKMYACMHGNKKIRLSSSLTTITNGSQGNQGYESISISHEVIHGFITSYINPIHDFVQFSK